MLHKFTEWLYFLFWMLGMFFISCLKLNFKDAIETSYWIRIHFKYTGQCVGYEKRSIWYKIINGLIVCFGFVVTIIIIFIMLNILIQNLQ
jgi:hypothetical protein